VDWLTNPEIWLAFLTLTVLEVVLGVDNVIFISILASKLPQVLLLDIVFSIDPVITAVGLTPHVPVMVAATSPRWRSCSSLPRASPPL
jgi:predicted tellurium resistance membrane protein TerC